MADETVKKYKERILKEISGDWGSLTPGKTKIKTIKGKVARKVYAKKVKLAEKTRKRKEKSKKRKDKKRKKILSKQQDTGTKLTRWFRKKTTGSGKQDRGGPTHDYDKPEVQKKVKVIKSEKGKKTYKQYMKGKKWDERKKKREAKAEYYHKTGKAPLIRDLPGVPSKLHKLFNPEFKDRKKAAKYDQPIVKYKAKGGPVKVVSKKASKKKKPRGVGIAKRGW